MNQPAKLSKTGITGWRRVTASDLRTSTENSQIMEVQSRHARLGTGLSPTATEISNRCAVRSRKQARLRRVALDALKQQLPHAARHRYLQALFVLRRPWFQSNDVGMRVDLLHAHLQE